MNNSEGKKEPGLFWLYKNDTTPWTRRPVSGRTIIGAIILGCSPLVFMATSHRDSILQPAVARRTTIEERLQINPLFKTMFEVNVRKCVELEVSPLVLTKEMYSYRRINLQGAMQEAEPACRRDEIMRWERAPSSYLVQKYG